MGNGVKDNDAPNPDTATSSEQWLRERGVQIETPNDRRKADAILTSEGDGPTPSIVEQIRRLTCKDDVSGGGEGAGVTFVYLPHNGARPVSTVHLPQRVVDALGAGDVLPAYVKAFFADGRSIDETLFKEQTGKQHLIGGDIGGADPAKLTSAALTSVTAEGSVETFALVRPSSTNNNQGVYIYLDEVGLLKKLPNNKRASTLAQQCGYHPAPNFYGDVFVGRVSSKNGLHNVDIEDADVIDSTKPWIRQAVQENVLWQQAVNKATGREGESQPDHAGTEGVGVRVESEDGAEGCAYVWMQNEEEVEMTVHLSNKVGEGSKANKALVRVGFQPQKITVKYDKETVLEVHLYSKLDVDGCTWTLDRCNLVITGEKASEGEMWPRLQLSG